MADLLGEVAVLVASVGGLWFGARAVVDAAVRLARGVGLSEVTVGLTVVAAGTSSPEFVVTADAAVAGLGDVAVGNVVGSNVFNLAVVLGVVSLVRVVPVERSLVRRDGGALVLATLAGGAALVDLVVSRPEGAALLAAMAAYVAVLLWTDGGSGRAADGADDGRAPGGDSGRAAGDRAVPTATAVRVAVRGRDGVALAVGLAVVLASGHFLVASATGLVRTAGVSAWVVGGTVVAAGTSTPELAVSLVALRRGRVGVSVGNVVGSNVTNTLGILGAAAVLRPLTVVPAARGGVAWLAVLVVVAVAAMWTGGVLSRAEGALLATSEALRWVLALVGVPG